MAGDGLDEFIQHLNMTSGFELPGEEDQLGDGEDDGSQYLSITGDGDGGSNENCRYSCDDVKCIFSFHWGAIQVKHFHVYLVHFFAIVGVISWNKQFTKTCENVSHKLLFVSLVFVSSECWRLNIVVKDRQQEPRGFWVRHQCVRGKEPLYRAMMLCASHLKNHYNIT